MSISAKLHVWKSDLFQAVGPVDLVDGVVQVEGQKAFGAVLPRMLDPIADCVENRFANVGRAEAEPCWLQGQEQGLELRGQESPRCDAAQCVLPSFFLRAVSVPLAIQDRIVGAE